MLHLFTPEKMTHQHSESERNQGASLCQPVPNDRGDMIVGLLRPGQRDKLIDKQSGYQRPEDPFYIHGSLVNQPVTNDITVVSAEDTSGGSVTPPKVPIAHTSRMETAPAKAPAPTFRVGISFSPFKYVYTPLIDRLDFISHVVMLAVIPIVDVF